jgi:hypothetical protein
MVVRVGVGVVVVIVCGGDCVGDGCCEKKNNNSINFGEREK